MTWEIAAVLVLLLFCLVALIRQWFPPEVVALSAMGLLLAGGILSTERVLAVFSNEGAITVACLFVLAAGLEKTGAVERIGRELSRRSGGREWAFRTILVCVACVLSAFMNNTAILLIFLPIVLGFCRTRGFPPSRFLIPLSFSTILGGCCTLIGTSTTLLVSGVAVQMGERPLSMFEITPVGVCLAVLGVVYLLVMGRHLLPDRETLQSIADQIKAREYLTEAVVVEGSPLVGKRLRETPLSKLSDVRIIEVSRAGETLVEPIDSILFEVGDRLLVKIVVANVARIQTLPGLAIAAGTDLRLQAIRTAPAVLVEGVVAPRSGLIGQTVRLANFRQKYHVLILAIHRQGENLSRKFEDVELRFGDVILMEGTEQAIGRVAQDPDFLMLSDVSGRRLRVRHAPAAVAVMVGFVLVATLGIVPVVTAAFLAALAMLLSGCLQPREAYRAVQWDTVLLIFGMLAVGTAFSETGAARWVVDQARGPLSGAPASLLLSAFFLLTNLLTAVLSNNAVGILMTPIAIQTARAIGVDPRPFLIATALAASLEFSTPIGYQTNTIVCGAGGYRFTDFLRAGVPLSLLAWIAASLLIPIFFPF